VDKKYITAFVKSVRNTFDTMLQLPVSVGEPSLKQPGAPAMDVSGIIGMSGDVEGAVVLSFPTPTAERIVTLFTGMEMTAADEDFADAIGELVNIVSGGAKAQFEGKRVDISCPSVVVGKDHQVFNAKDVVCVSIPCASDCGDFAVEVSFRNVGAGAGAADRAAASA